VFVGLVEVAGYFGRLAIGLESLGYPTVFVNLAPDTYSFPSPRSGGLLPRAAALCSRRRARSEGRAAVSFWRAISLALRPLLLLWALPRFDVFVFAFGSTFANGYDLRLLRFAGKRVISVFSGSDIRPPYIDGAALRGTGRPDMDTLLALVRRRYSRAKRAERSSNVVVSHPLYAQFLSRPFVHFMAIGVPTEVPEHWEAPRRTQRPLRVLHAPSDPLAKGTALIRAVVRHAADAGMPLDYRELTGVPHAEVLRALEWADVVLDQAFSDIPWAGLASEAGARGRPCVVGGYGWQELASAVPRVYLPPAVLTRPDQLIEGLRRLADPAVLASVAEEARAFAEGHLGQASVRRFAHLIEDDIPSDWWAAPSATDYCLGWGVERTVVGGIVGEFVRKHGVSALCLDHAPATRQRLLDLSSQAEEANQIVS
jgi:hypothetical protein